LDVNLRIAICHQLRVIWCKAPIVPTERNDSLSFFLPTRCSYGTFAAFE
jgi:hypothetical protein